MNSYYDEAKGWIIDGQSLEEFREANQPVTDEDLKELGIIEEPEQTEESALAKVDKFMGYDTRPTGAKYEKLNAWDTAVDVVKAVGTEASHLFLPKSMEAQYIERTHLAEGFKNMYRYGIGTIGFGKIGATMKGTAAAPKIAKALGTFLHPNLIQTENKLIKTATVGLDNLGAAAVAAFVLRRPEEMEGHFADIFSETDNELIKALQTNPNDHQIQDRLKGMVEDTIIGLFTAPVFDIAAKLLFKLGEAIVKGIKSKFSKEAVEEIVEEATKLDNLSNKASIIQNVKTAIEQASKEGVEDTERYLLDLDRVKNSDNQDQILDVYKRVVDGQELTVGDDGNIQTVVNSWRDAAHVTPEQLKTQTGNDGIKLMDEAVKDTWKERGWLAEGEDLVKITNPTDNSKTAKLTVNTKATNRIVKQYTDKWQLDNNVKVEWVEGQINGADGNTLATKYKGKIAKNNQNAIDKKKLQIQQIKDKITMKEGGNTEVSDPLDVLKKQLRIAENELKQLNDINSKANLVPDITIQINKNAKNPYAILRSELEHARDIAKRTVPNQKVQHFSRYSGINESEMSLGYVKKKADSRLISKKVDGDLDNFLKTAKEGVNAKTPYAHIRRITDVLTDDTLKDILEDVKDTVVRVMTKEEQQEVNKLVGSREFGSVRRDATGHYQIVLNPDLTLEEARKTLYHELQHVKQLKRAEIDPEYKAKIDNYFSEIEGDIPESYFNQELELEANQAEVEWEKIRKSYNVHQSATGNVETKQPIHRSSQEASSGTSTDGELNRGYSKEESSGRDTTSLSDGSSQNKTEIQQSDFRPISKQLTSTGGDLDQIEKVVSDVVARDTELSGTNWDALAKDADDLFNKLEEYGIKDIDNLKKAFNHGQIDVINTATRYVLAAERMIGNLREQAAAILKQNGDITEIAESLAYLSDFTSKIGSALGRGLNEVKVVNKARTFFSLTTLEKQGLDNLTDLLYTDITSLNFTRNAKQLKADLYNKVQHYVGGNFFNELMSNSGLRKSFDSIVDKLIKSAKDGKLSSEVVNKELKGLITQTKIDDVKNTIIFSNDNKKLMKAMRFLNGYYVNNLLSSPIPTLKGLISGGMNTFYFPFKKIVASFLTNDTDLSKELFSEGIKTYQYLFSVNSVVKDAWKMCWKTLKDGDGTLISLGRKSPNNSVLESGLPMTNFMDRNNSPFQHLWNIISIPSRIMGAGDELLTQLNYRAITMARAYNQAELGADTLKLTGKLREEYITKQTDNLFKQAFNTEGKPLDTNAYAEARDVVLQTPLEGTYHDYGTGKSKQVKNQSTVMFIGKELQNLMEHIPVLRIFQPFIRTGTNIAQQNLEHNGLYASLSTSQRNLCLSNTREGAIARAQVATGTLSMFTALGFVLNGRITGAAPIDETEKKALFETGWRPYSIRVGNQWFSYEGYEPLHTILGFTADACNMFHSWDTAFSDTENLINFTILGIQAVMDNFIDKTSFRTSMENMYNIFEWLDNDSSGEAFTKAGGKLAKGFLPYSSLGSFVSSFENTSQTKPKGFYQNFANKYFGITGALGDYRRNTFGERIDLYNCFLTKYSEEDTSIETEELRRLGEAGWYPSMPSSLEAKFKYDYKQFKCDGRSLFDKIMETQSEITLEGKTLREALAELIESNDYQTKPDGIDDIQKSMKDTKVKDIKAVLKRYREAAKEEVIREYGDDYLNKEGQTSKEHEQMIREAQEEAMLDSDLADIANSIRSFS